MPREWTDLAEFSPSSQPSVLEFQCLLKLTEILEDALKKGLDS